MPNEEALNPADRGLEAALGALRPAPSVIDRDRLMFDAGRRAARRRPVLWQAVSGALAAALLLSLALHRSSPRGVERIVYVPSSASPGPLQTHTVAPTGEDDPTPPRDFVSAASTPSASTYLALRQRVLTDDAVNLTPIIGDHAKRTAPSKSGVDFSTEAGFFGRTSIPDRERL